MKSIFSSAVLGAATLAQVAFSASIHGHGHMHRRAPTQAVSVEERDTAAVQFISTDDITALENKGILIGQNLACSEGSQPPVTVGQDGPFTVELNNNSTEDIIVVVWSGSGQWGAVGASFIGGAQPDVTHTLQSGTTTWISFNPANATGNAISGGLGAVYEDTGLTSFSGQLSNSWVEYTFTNTTQFSTTDVSRLVNMNGNDVVVENYASKSDTTPACTSDMTACAFICDGDVDHCEAGSITGCPVGEAGNTSNGVDDGGCGGMTAEGGYVVVTFK